MTTIVELSVDAPAVALPTFASRADIRAELVPMAGDDAGLSRVLRTSVADAEAATTTLEEDPTVAAVRDVSPAAEGTLCRVEWATVGPLVEFLFAEQDASIERAVLADGRWRLRVWFPTSQDVSAVLTFDEGTAADEVGLGLESDTDGSAGPGSGTLTVDRIYTHADPDRTEDDLSDAQHEAVRLAVEEGYYRIPRGSTTADLAERLDISQQALSERLRRAHGTLARDAVTDADRDISAGTGTGTDPDAR